jgi:hypothetical protein
MGKFSREKGMRYERHVVHRFQEAGFAAERIPLSGAAGGRFSGDVSVPVLGMDVTLECKKRANGFKELYGWLAEHHAVVVAADNKPDLICLKLSDYIRLAQIAEAVFKSMGEAA